MDRVTVMTDIRRANQDAARENRALFDKRGSCVINLMSAPGAGKTSVLEATIREIASSYDVAVIEGDLQTTLDSDRIRAAGAPAFQITTGSVCHLDARMIAKALAEFRPGDVDLLIIENVGNLVCPAEFDLGEHLRVMVCSVVEGADKPKKYPLMFHTADVVLLNKIDLLPYAGVALSELWRNVAEVNPRATVFPVSCRTGEGMHAWIGWLTEKLEARRNQARSTSQA
jgi:hydrogenase nickel incorporation protein HypB